MKKVGLILWPLPSKTKICTNKCFEMSSVPKSAYERLVLHENEAIFTRFSIYREKTKTKGKEQQMSTYCKAFQCAARYSLTFVMNDFTCLIKRTAGVSVNLLQVRVILPINICRKILEKLSVYIIYMHGSDDHKTLDLVQNNRRLRDQDDYLNLCIWQTLSSKTKHTVKL